jgi:hypothetical protein
VQPDRERLLDEARIDFAMDWLRHSAGELLGDEVVELGRHAGERVRIVGRMRDGALVAAALAKPAAKGAARVDKELASELEELAQATRDAIRGLLVRATGELEAPVSAELTPH